MPQPPTVGEAIRAGAWRILLSAGAATAIVFGVLRYTAGRFYAEFGLAPEDVGLDETQLLARSAGLAIVALVIAAALALVVTILADLVRSASDKDTRTDRWETAFAVALFAAFVTSDVAPPLSAILVGVAFAIVAMGAVIREGPLIWHARMHGWVRGIAVACGFLVVAFTVSLLLASATDSKSRVRDGQGVAPRDAAFVPWHATVVELEWIGSKPPPDALEELRCGVYLGAGNGSEYIVDPRTDRTLRIPSGNLVTVNLPGDATCR